MIANYAQAGSNLRKLWKVNKSIIYNSNNKENTSSTQIKLSQLGKIITNSNEIAEEFDNHFVRVGPRLACKIPLGHSKKDYCSNILSPTHSLYLQPTTEDEIRKIVLPL